MSDERYPTAPTDTSDPAFRSTAAVSASNTSTTSTDYASQRAAISGLRVERDPSVTADTAESAMAEVRARMLGQPTIGIGTALSPKLAAQRDARMVESANFAENPDLVKATPLQEQTQEAPAPVRPGATKPVAGKQVQNLKGVKAAPKPVIGRWTQQVANALRAKQQAPKAPTR